jgi:hypothetical protein
MEKETLKKIFEFLEENGEHNPPLMWKLQNNIPITEKDDLIVKGSLDLSSSNITSLPKGLKVGGLLIIIESDLLKYSDEEIRKMIEPGYIKKKIVREYYR